ncbi:MAG: hypothetical protein KGJ13_06345 [Patescibacteria group bacterium]|nr:hypothetical protein [Patescibacteria group bacterium]
MKVNATFGGILALFAVGIVSYLVWKNWDKIKQLGDVTSQNNIVSGPVNKVVESITGVQGDTLGTAINRGVQDVKNFFTGNPINQMDQTQVVKTCKAILAAKGTLKSTICLDALGLQSGQGGPE